MLRRALGVRMTVVHIVLMTVLATATTTCKRTASSPPLAAPPEVSAPAAAPAKKTVAYRTQSGTPIAPSVVPDDSPPAPLQVMPEKVTAPRTTLNGNPKGIDRETLNRSIQRSMGALGNCFSSTTQDPTVAVSFEADPSGRPSLVRVSGAPPDAEYCVRNVVQAIRFPAFEGQGVHIDLPLSFHRVQSQAQTRNQPAPQGRVAPTLFLQP